MSKNKMKKKSPVPMSSMTSPVVMKSPLYNTEKQNIEACIKFGGNVLKYKKDNININIPSDLYEHYKNYKFYSEPKLFKSAF